MSIRLFARARPELTYAEQRYRRGVRSWRRRIRPWLLVIFGPPFVVSLVWGISLHHNGALIAGFIAGASGAMAIAFREFAPPYVENWGRGSEGERRTHRVLSRLGWELVEDVGTGHGNYDHLLVGPPGVFMIETKNLTGIAEVREGVPWLRRRHDPDADQPQTRIEGRVLSGSAEVSGAIRAQTRRRVWVAAIVVFWNDFPQGLVETDKVVYVHGSRLRRYLGELPRKLDNRAETDIAGVLKSIKSDGEYKPDRRERHASTTATTSGG